MLRHFVFVAAAMVVLAACGGKTDETEDIATVEAETTQAASTENEKNDAKSSTPLQPEPIPNVLSLPANYPDTWFFAHDLNFFNLLDGKVVILDAAAETREYKGQLPSGMGAFAQSRRRGELYVAETIMEFRVRGARRDILMVYDTATLNPLAEIELPAKRFQGMPFKQAFVLIDNDRLALVYNFSPAASVSVVDLDKREVVSEIPIPGCAMMFPAGARGFSTICGNGGLTTVQLDENGGVLSEVKSEPFIDIDNDAMFMKSAEMGGVRYFPTFLGNIQPIDFRGEAPALLEPWSLFSAAEAAEGLRPGGWQLITNDALGEFYVLVHPDGAEGTHKNPSAEIWVYSMAQKRRVRKIALKTPALSIELTKGENPYLIAMNIELELDIYDAKAGEWLRKIGGLATETAFGLYAVE